MNEASENVEWVFLAISTNVDTFKRSDYPISYVNIPRFKYSLVCYGNISEKFNIKG